MTQKNIKMLIKVTTYTSSSNNTVNKELFQSNTIFLYVAKQRLGISFEQVLYAAKMSQRNKIKYMQG